MAVSKLSGKNINDYVFTPTEDPYDYPERLHKLAEHLRSEGSDDEDYDDEADDLDDAADELEQLLDRIVNTIEDDIDYEK